MGNQNLYQVVGKDGTEQIGLISSDISSDVMDRIRETLSLPYFVDSDDIDLLINRIKACGHKAERVFVIELN